MKKDNTPNIFKLMFVGFALIGVGLLIGDWFAYRITTDFLHKSTSTTGVVVSNQRQTNSDGEVFFYPFVQFDTAKGERIEFRSSTGSNSSEYAIGTKVSVLYDSANAQKAEIDSFFSLWLGVLVLSILGITSSAVGIGGFFLFSKAERSEGFLEQKEERDTEEELLKVIDRTVKEGAIELDLSERGLTFLPPEIVNSRTCDVSISAAIN